MLVFENIFTFEESLTLKRVIVSVINDLVTDQRVDKVCRNLTRNGFEVLLVGRRKRDSMPMDERPYKTHRMRLAFEKGPLFYAEYNIRLFLLLLFKKAGLLLSNDLDTLLPNYLISKLKNIDLVYDSHELFTETPEVIHRKFVKNTWESIERSIVPKLKDAYTVNGSIADIFRQKYNVDFKVVRNIPAGRGTKNNVSRSELELPEDKKIILLQGAGINIQRGSEELIEAVQFLDKSYLLLIVGGGDVIHILKKTVKEKGLDDKVWFRDKMPPEKLFRYTANADLGITIDKDTNLNYRYSLPNKLFDYIHAGIPVLASDLPEIAKIVREYKVGDFIPDHQPESIANKISEMLSDEEKLRDWKENIKFAAGALVWENEEKTLNKIFQKYA